MVGGQEAERKNLGEDKDPSMLGGSRVEAWTKPSPQVEGAHDVPWSSAAYDFPIESRVAAVLVVRRCNLVPCPRGKQKAITVLIIAARRLHGCWAAADMGQG